MKSILWYVLDAPHFFYIRNRIHIINGINYRTGMAVLLTQCAYLNDRTLNFQRNNEKFLKTNE